MAKLADHFPYAVHVVPLHAWRSISESRVLLSTSDREKRGIYIGRASSATIDRVLGFGVHVHFYLSTSEQPLDVFRSAPILRSKLLAPSPFPHLALLVKVRGLADDACTVSCWNIGRSKPAVTGVKQSGSVLPSDTPEGIREHWRKFRSEPPSRQKGIFLPGFDVPIVPPTSYKSFESTISKDAQELLMPSPFPIPDDALVWALSRWDSQSLKPLGLCRWKRFCKEFPGYGDLPRDPVAVEVRDQIGRHFDGGPFPTLDYD